MPIKSRKRTSATLVKAKVAPSTRTRESAVAKHGTSVSVHSRHNPNTTCEYSIHNISVTRSKIVYFSSGGAFWRWPRRADLGAARLGRRRAAQGVRPRGPRPRPRLMARASRSPSRKHIVSFAGPPWGPAPVPPPPARLSGPRETRFRALWAQGISSTKGKKRSSAPAKDALLLAHTRPCDRRTPPHPSTRTRDHVQRRASVRTPRTTRLLELSSTVVYCAPFARRYQRARAEGGERVAGRGPCVAQKLSLDSPVREAL